MKFNVYYSGDTKRYLAVFARAPRPGEVKTRLASILHSKAADFYAAILRDVLSMAQYCASQAGSQITLFYTPEDAFTNDEHSLKAYWMGHKHPQSAGDIGVRMLSCLNHLRQGNASTHILLIGSDSPDLPPEYLLQAFEKLATFDLVFGPARDGGFYCIGTSRAVPDTLFQNVEWSSSRTLQQVLVNAEELQLHVALLPAWDDVDTPDDLQLLMQRLQHTPQSAPHTVIWLQANLDH